MSGTFKYFLILNFFLCGWMAHADQYQKKATRRAKLIPQKVIQFADNPYIQSCLKNDPYPKFKSAIVRVDRDEDSQNYLVSFRFALENYKKVFVRSASGHEQELHPETKGTFYLSLIIPAQTESNQGQLHLQLRLVSKKGQSYFYDLDTSVDQVVAQITPRFTREQREKVCLKNQIWIGGGGSYFSYKQNTDGLDVSASFDSVKLGSYDLDMKTYPTPNWGFLASYKSAPGLFDKGQVQGVQQSDFAWTIAEVGLQYRRNAWLITKEKYLAYPYVRASVQRHSMPRIGVDGSSQVFIENIENTQGSIGIGANIFTKANSFFEVYINYQFPVSEGDYSLSPKLEFDGAVGFGRALTEHLSFGAYWYGHFRHVRYENPSSLDPDPGEVNFLFSNFDLRLGWIF